MYSETKIPFDWAVLADLVVRLTELRMGKCEHLCIEEFAPELLGKFMREILRAPYVIED